MLESASLIPVQRVGVGLDKQAHTAGGGTEAKNNEHELKQLSVAVCAAQVN